MTENVLLEPIRQKTALDTRKPMRRSSVASAESDPMAVIDAAPSDRPFVVAQLGQSLDGRIATSTGESRWINGDAALDHVHRLRAHVDAVVVGVGTAETDDPRLTVRRTSGRNPARVVIDPRGRLSGRAKCLTDDGARRVVIGCQRESGAAGIEQIVLERNGPWLCPHKIVASLFDTGLKKLLIEGGAQTISAFIDAGAIDRLHVLVAPVILGSGKQGLDLKPIEKLLDARRPETTAHVLEGGEVLFDCNLRRCA